MCERHKQRSRKNCPDCYPVTLKEEVSIAIVGKKLKEKGVTKAKSVDIKTSRDMLKDLDKMEREEAELVIKPQRKKRVNNKAPLKLNLEVPEDINTNEYKISQEQIQDAIKEATRLDIYKRELESIDKFFKDKLEEFKQKINSECNLTYEHLAIPYDSCSVREMEYLEKLGFGLVNFWKGALSTISGYKGQDVAVFKRVKKDGFYKKSVEELKIQYKEKK